MEVNAAALNTLILAAARVGRDKPETGTLEEDKTIQGIFLKAGTFVMYRENGRLDMVKPKEDITIKGVTYKAGEQIYFHNNGKVSSGTLAKDTMLKPRNTRIKEIALKANTKLVFDPAGRLWQIDTRDVKGYTEIQGFAFPPHSVIHLDQFEKLYSATCWRDVKVKGHTYTPPTKICFDIKGNPQPGGSCE